MMTRTPLMHPLKMLTAVGAAFLVWGLLLAYAASPAHAAGSCSITAGVTTCTFGPTGAEDTFTVPAGVSSIHVVATGAPGAVSATSFSAGRGAEVSGDLTVTTGDTLYVEVGGAPTGGGNCFSGVACVGGFNGGGSSRSGGGGGGASDVREQARDQSGSLSSRLIVAAGGGGSGQGTFCRPNSTVFRGGAGGDAGSNGGTGEKCVTVAGGTGGGAGGQTASGAGGSPDGQSGSLGLGGNGGGNSGGGGGGGLYGGGGGGSLVFGSFGSEPIQAPAGGGGGGSNLVPTGGNATIANSGPSITISYTLPNTAPVANDDSATTDEDTPTDIAVLSNDTDDDGGDTLSVSTLTQPAHGAVSENADGTLKYTPNVNYNGADSFTYSATDGTEESNTAIVSIPVDPVNDAPSFTKGADQTVNQDAGAQSVSGWATNISAGSPDESGQQVSFDLTNYNNGLFTSGGQPALSPDGTLTYTPAAARLSA